MNDECRAASNGNSLACGTVRVDRRLCVGAVVGGQRGRCWANSFMYLLGSRPWTLARRARAFEVARVRPFSIRFPGTPYEWHFLKVV